MTTKQSIQLWDLLEKITWDIKDGKINNDIESLNDIRCLYFKAKQFIKAVENNPKY